MEIYRNLVAEQCVAGQILFLLHPFFVIRRRRDGANKRPHDLTLQLVPPPTLAAAFAAFLPFFTRRVLLAAGLINEAFKSVRSFFPTSFRSCIRSSTSKCRLRIGK